MERQRDVCNLLIGCEHDIGDSVQRVLHGSAGVPRKGFDDGRPDALPVRAERYVGAAIRPPSRQIPDQQPLQSIGRSVVVGDVGARREPGGAHDGQATDAGDDGDLLAVARDGGGLQLGRAPDEGLSLQASTGMEPSPRLFGDFDPCTRDGAMLLQDAIAEREAELFDLTGSVLTRSTVDEVFECLTRREPIGTPLAKRGGEVPFEPERHRQFLRVVPVAAPHDAQHPDPRLAVTARPDSRHSRTVPWKSWSAAPEHRICCRPS